MDTNAGGHVVVEVRAVRSLPNASIFCDTERKCSAESEDVGGVRRKEEVLRSHL